MHNCCNFLPQFVDCVNDFEKLKTQNKTWKKCLKAIAEPARMVLKTWQNRRRSSLMKARTGKKLINKETLRNTIA